MTESCGWWTVTPGVAFVDGVQQAAKRGKPEREAA